MHRLAIEHFYHVVSSEDLRHSMTEALITNAPLPGTYVKSEKPRQFALEIV